MRAKLNYKTRKPRREFSVTTALKFMPNVSASGGLINRIENEILRAAKKGRQQVYVLLPHKNAVADMSFIFKERGFNVYLEPDNNIRITWRDKL